MHLTLETCLAVCRGELSPEVFLRSVHRHLVEVCAGCGREWRSASRVSGGIEPFPVRAAGGDDLEQRPLPEDPRLVRPGHLAARQRLLSRLLRERRDARAELDKLLAETPAARLRRFERARRGLASAALAEMLVEASRERVRTDPADAESLAALVPRVLARAPGGGGEGWSIVLAARAEAHRANALRVAGDLRRAANVFAELRAALAARPLPDRTAEAEILSLEASLDFDRRDLTAAVELLDRALAHYREDRDAEGAARASILKAMALYALNDPGAALAALEEAAPGSDPERDLYLATSAVAARVVFLCTLGRPAEAEAIVAGHRDLFARLDDEAAESTLHGLDGWVALGLGRLAEAETAFVTARDGFLALGRDYDAILASLALATVLLEAGKTRELRRLAAELVPTFRARGVAREALAALRLFAQATAADELTRELLDRLRVRLETAAPSAAAPAGV